jgi:hypothetical protein
MFRDSFFFSKMRKIKWFVVVVLLISKVFYVPVGAELYFKLISDKVSKTLTSSAPAPRLNFAHCLMPVF